MIVSKLNRRPVLLLQTFATFNGCWCSFPAAGGKSMAVYISAPYLRISGGTTSFPFSVGSRPLVGRLPVSLRCLECERRRVRSIVRAATWRESSSSRWSKLASVSEETEALEDLGATSHMRSTSCEAESKLPSDWPATIA
jgi:hypothetical protein